MGISNSLYCYHKAVRKLKRAIKNHLTAAHISDKQNIADNESRVSHVDAKWMLSSEYLHQSLDLLYFNPGIDLLET